MRERDARPSRRAPRDELRFRPRLRRDSLRAGPSCRLTFNAGATAKVGPISEKSHRRSAAPYDGPVIRELDGRSARFTPRGGRACEPPVPGSPWGTGRLTVGTARPARRRGDRPGRRSPEPSWTCESELAAAPPGRCAAGRQLARGGLIAGPVARSSSLDPALRGSTAATPSVDPGHRHRVRFEDVPLRPLRRVPRRERTTASNAVCADGAAGADAAITAAPEGPTASLPRPGATGRAQKKRPAFAGLSQVAGAGFEPATFGL